MSLPSAKPAGKLEEKQRQALITLLADEDVGVYRTVRDKIISYGPDSSRWMREHALSSDPVLRRRGERDHSSFCAAGRGHGVAGVLSESGGGF